MNTTHTSRPLGHVSAYLKSLADQPPTSPEENQAAAVTLARHAAIEAQGLYTNESRIQARVSILTGLAGTYRGLAETGLLLAAADASTL